MLYNGAYLCFYGELQMLTKSFSSMVCSKTPPQALKNISLKQNKLFKGGLPYPLSQKMAAEFVV